VEDGGTGEVRMELGTSSLMFTLLVGGDISAFLLELGMLSDV
jgi:hypothetical protein